MGEAKRRAVANGSTAYLMPKSRVRMVHRVQLENLDAEGLTILMLGAREPEICTAMTPSEARKLCAEILKHAEAIEQTKSSIIIPGGLA